MVNNGRLAKKGIKGFSLVEVLTATIVMTMMMVAVIGYIQYGAMVWQKGHSKMAAENYSRLAFDLIKQDLLNATFVGHPTASTSVTVETGLGYRLSGVTEDFKLTVPSATERVLTRIIDSADTDKMRTWNTRIARNVNLFQVTRISTWTFRIDLQIRSDLEATEDADNDSDVDFNDRPIISSESLVLTAPGAGG